MKNNIYKTCNLIASRKVKSGATVININDLMREAMALADFSGMTEEEMQRTILRLTLTSILNAHRYYSVVRRKGLFANSENCKKAYLKQLIENAKHDVRRLEKLLKRLNDNLDIAEIDGQMAFDADTMEIFEEMTEEELVEMLREEAEEYA